MRRAVLEVWPLHIDRTTYAFDRLLYRPVLVRVPLISVGLTAARHGELEVPHHHLGSLQ